MRPFKTGGSVGLFGPVCLCFPLPLQFLSKPLIGNTRLHDQVSYPSLVGIADQYRTAYTGLFLYCFLVAFLLSTHTKRFVFYCKLDLYGLTGFSNVRLRCQIE